MSYLDFCLVLLIAATSIIVIWLFVWTLKNFKLEEDEVLKEGVGIFGKNNLAKVRRDLSINDIQDQRNVNKELLNMIEYQHLEIKELRDRVLSLEALQKEDKIDGEE